MGALKDSESGSAAAPVDLEIRVTLTTVGGKHALKYTLSSPSGVVPFESRKFLSEPILRPPEDFHRYLLGQIEQLSRNENVDRAAFRRIAAARSRPSPVQRRAVVAVRCSNRAESRVSYSGRKTRGKTQGSTQLVLGTEDAEAGV